MYLRSLVFLLAGLEIIFIWAVFSPSQENTCSSQRMFCTEKSLDFVILDQVLQLLEPLCKMGKKLRPTKQPKVIVKKI